jgi:hypothetical protein
MMHISRTIPRVFALLAGLALVGSLLISPGRATAQGGVGQCAVNRGVALLWDMTHSVFNGVPFVPPELPLPGANWVLYQHPAWPLLTFLHPPDWRPMNIADGHTVGVDLIRADGAAAWQYLGTPSQGLTAREWVEAGLRAVFGLEPQTPLEVLCESELPAVGVFQNTSVLVVSVEPYLAFSLAATVSDGLTTSVFYRALIGPAPEFSTLTDKVFLPIEWQLLCPAAEPEC